MDSSLYFQNKSGFSKIKKEFSYDKRKKIRPIAVAIVKNEGKVLAMKCYDHKKSETFYRLLGGGIDFAEKAKDTLIREFKEELGVDIKINSFLEVVENVFEFDGNKGHEICFVYEAELIDKKLYHQNKIQMIEPEYKDVLVIWIEPKSDTKIYPLHPQNLK